MSTVYLLVTVLAALLNGWAAYVDLAQAEWVIANMAKYGIPRSWLFWLGLAKAVGAVGLLVGIAAPGLGLAASVGLVVYFLGAIVTVLRSGNYSDLRYPTPFLLVAVASLVLRLTVT
jgi:hypothetical protein